MVAGIADTHTAPWHLYGDMRLSRTASAFIENTAAQGFTIGVSPISLAEIIYLVEKSRIPSDAFGAIARILNDANEVFGEVPLNQEIIGAMRESTVTAYRISRTGSLPRRPSIFRSPYSAATVAFRHPASIRFGK